MRLEFTYELADLREARVPERFAANPEKYARRWIRVVVTWVFVLAIMAADFWMARLTTGASSRGGRYLRFELRTEFLPSAVPALYVSGLYLIAIRKNWRALRNRDSLNSPELDTASRIFGMLVGVLVGLAIWAGMLGTWDRTWRATPAQVALITFAPWAVLIVLMQVLGFIQRRALVVGVWRSNAGLRRPKTAALDHAMLHLQDARCQLDFQWSYFERARETKNLLILVGEGGMQYVIPKRAFAEPVDLERCRSLLQNVIPNTRFLVRPVGFAVLPQPVLPLPALSPGASPAAPMLTPTGQAVTMPPSPDPEGLQ